MYSVTYIAFCKCKNNKYSCQNFKDGVFLHVPESLVIGNLKLVFI